MTWQERHASRGRILMFLTTFPWWKWLKLSVDVATHPPVPHAKDGALWPVLGHGASQKHLIRAQEDDRGHTTSNRHSAAAAAAAVEGIHSVYLCYLSLLLLSPNVELYKTRACHEWLPRPHIERCNSTRQHSSSEYDIIDHQVTSLTPRTVQAGA